MPTLLQRFLDGEIDNTSFGHVDHVRVAFDIVQTNDFASAVGVYCRGLKQIAALAGRPEAFHMTITIAYLSMIAERAMDTTFAGFKEFAAANPDLLDKSALTARYRPGVLNSEIARKTFVLPGAQ